jgi:hypothetical protein
MTLQGDPALDLLFATPEERQQIGMTGSPYGRRAAFSPFSWGHSLPPSVRRGTTHALWVATTCSLPDFEIILRQADAHLAAPAILDPGHGGFAEVHLGVTELDDRFRLVTSLPRIASFLRPALGRLAHEPFVHLFHSHRAPGLLTSIADGAGLAPVLRNAEEHLYALELIACAVEGRPLPDKRTFA